MRAEITGTQPRTPNDTNHPVKEPQSQSESDLQELTPDRPPQSLEASERQPRRPRGFAAMDRSLVSEIARKGGKAAHSAGTAHEFTSDEARAAGQKGGRATHAKRRKAIADTSGTPPQGKQGE